MVATGPDVFSTSLAVSAPALQPSMSPAAVKTGPVAASAAVCTAPRIGTKASDAARTTAPATVRRHDDRLTRSPRVRSRSSGRYRGSTSRPNSPVRGVCARLCRQPVARYPAGVYWRRRGDRRRSARRDTATRRVRCRTGCAGSRVRCGVCSGWSTRTGTASTSSARSRPSTGRCRRWHSSCSTTTSATAWPTPWPRAAPGPRRRWPRRRRPSPASSGPEMSHVLAVVTPGDVGDSLREGFFMFWETLWALVVGFGLSGAVQAFVSKEEMQRVLGDHRPRTILRASGFGMVSSSCSYAASAMAKSLFQKGADFVSAMVFMFASTNLVVELGVVLLILMGWQFALAEFIGGPIMIALLALVGGVLFPAALVRRARQRLQQGIVGGHDHQAMVGVS